MAAAKFALLSKARAAGLFQLARRRSAPAVRILCYHGVWLGGGSFRGDAMFMRAQTFRRHLAIIREQNYAVVTLKDAMAALSGNGPALPPAAVVITIDDGWYSTYSTMLPVLREFGMPATLYCDTANLQSGQPIAHVLARYLDLLAGLQASQGRSSLINVEEATAARRTATDLSATRTERADAAKRLGRALGMDVDALIASRTFDYMSAAELREARASGLDVQLHTHNHTLGDMGATAVEKELFENRCALADILECAPSEFSHFCYPSGRVSQSAAKALAAIGLSSSVTGAAGLAWPGTDIQLLPRILDGENVSDLEFEAALSGFADWLRSGRRLATKFMGFGAPGSGARTVVQQPIPVFRMESARTCEAGDRLSEPQDNPAGPVR